MQDWQPGLHCVCVDDTFDPWVHKLYTALPKKDQSYVVRDVRLGVRMKGKRTEGDISLLLIGIVNPRQTSKAGLEMGFSADRFRPLDELQEEAAACKRIGEMVEILEKLPKEALQEFVKEFNK